MKTLIRITEKIISLVLFAIGAFLIFYFFMPFANAYLHAERAVGGDYFNGLNYAVHFAQHLPLPPQGWLSFWNGGIPIIGGYPTLTFYAMSPLFLFFDPSSAMEIFIIGMLFLYFFVSLVLFYLITESSPAAFILTLILLVSNNSYYQLFSEGLIVATSIQWLLPASLLFMHLYKKNRKYRFLTLSAVFTGISLIQHPGLGGLTIAIPNLVFLTIASGRIKSKIYTAFIYVLLITGISALTVLPLISQAFGGNISGMCNNAQCWGLYPQHLQLWFNSATPIIVASLTSLVFISKLINKKVLLKPVAAILIAVILVSLYPLAAYFHLINGFASAIFPRRIFWTLNLLLLVMGAYAYTTLRAGWGKICGYMLSGVFLSLSIYVIVFAPKLITLDTKRLFNRPDTIPDNIDAYIVPKYKNKSLDQILPGWVISKSADSNYRFDSLNQQATVWWNVIAEMPATRGYSNAPQGIHAAWLYYFQVGTAENSPLLNPDLIDSRSRFLLDHYAVGLYDDSGRSASSKLGYPQTILADPNLIKNKETSRELNFYELSSDIISPLISPSESTPMLVISDDTGYETVVRSLSYTGLTSKMIIPVKGPPDFTHLTPIQKQIFPILFLYRFEGKDFKQLEKYVEDGGSVIIDFASAKNKLPESLPDFFPSGGFSEINLNGKLELIGSSSTLMSNVAASQFAPFIYKGKSWKAFKFDKLHPAADSILQTNTYQLLLSINQNKGRVIVSGLNLPFHIVDTQNYEEVKLFKNILIELIGSDEVRPTAAHVERKIPEVIKVTGATRGIYFKENFDRGWVAKTSSKQLSVYMAGPGFMYIPTPDVHSQVTLAYLGTGETWGLFLISMTTLIISILVSLLPKRLFTPITGVLLALFNKRWQSLKQDEQARY